MPVRPPWGRTCICVVLRPRVRHAHPRLQSSSAPLGPPSPSPSPQQSRGSDVVPVAIPAACRGGIAVLMPHLYRHPAMLPAPQGSHYSITAGERSEPAEGACLHHHRPQGGRTLVVCGCPAPASLGWQLSTGLLPWLAVQSVCPFDPLGAVHIYVWLFVRGFAMLTRGYRVVRPPWGRGSLSGGVGAACVLSVCGACLMPVRPPWGRTYICVALLPRVRHAHPRLQSSPRVRHAHPRLQSSSAPLGPPSPSPFRCKIAGATPSPQHAVVVPPSPYHICTGIPRSCRPRRGRTTL